MSTMAHLLTGLWVFAPTSRDGGRHIKMSPHERVHFSCRDNSFGQICARPYAEEATIPRRHNNENRQHIIFSSLASMVVALRPQTPTNIHWDYLCNRHVKCYGLYPMQRIKSDAVNRINSSCRNINHEAKSAPCSVARSMPPPPDICPPICTIR